MRRMLLMSIVLALLVIPFVAARERNPIRALRTLFLLWLGFALFYLLAMRYIYPLLP